MEVVSTALSHVIKSIGAHVVFSPYHCFELSFGTGISIFLNVFFGISKVYEINFFIQAWEGLVVSVRAENIVWLNVLMYKPLLMQLSKLFGDLYPNFTYAWNRKITNSSNLKK